MTAPIELGLGSIMAGSLLTANASSSLGIVNVNCVKCLEVFLVEPARLKLLVCEALTPGGHGLGEWVQRVEVRGGLLLYVLRIVTCRKSADVEGNVLYWTVTVGGVAKYRL